MFKEWIESQKEKEEKEGKKNLKLKKKKKRTKKMIYKSDVYKRTPAEAIKNSNEFGKK